jgi:TfoX/Sxy family transcriptional regulator of competence genes
MAFDENLAARIRSALASRTDVVEKRMFGGLAFMVNGRMCCGIVKTDLMLRVGPSRQQEMLAKPHARVMDFTGRPSNGMIYVSPEGLRTDTALRSWIGEALEFVMSPELPVKAAKLAKTAKPRKPRARR